MRFMGRTGLVLAGIVVANILLLNGMPLYADLIPSAPVAVPAASPGMDRVAVEKHMAEAGLSPAEIAARISQLEPKDVTVLADNPKQVQMAGLAGPNVVYFILALVVVAAIVVLIDSSSEAETPEAGVPAGNR